MAKFNPMDILLDLKTGDACFEDVLIQEAAGKIRVAESYFNALYKISEIPEGMPSMIVQEMETAADIFNGDSLTQEQAVEFAAESVKQSLTAFYTLLSATAKKIKAAQEKNMKLIAAFAKKQGVSFSAGGDNFESSVDSLCKSLDKGGIKLNVPKFLKAKSSYALTEMFGSASAYILAAYGIECDFADKNIVGNFGNIKAPAAASNVNDIKRTLATGGSWATKGTKFLGGDSAKGKLTDKVTANDLRNYCYGVYALIVMADCVLKKTGGDAKKSAINHLVKAIDGDTGKSQKSVSNTQQMINEGVKEWSDGLMFLSDKITRLFGDSAYALAGGGGAKAKDTAKDEDKE